MYTILIERQILHIFVLSEDDLQNIARPSYIFNFLQFMLGIIVMTAMPGMESPVAGITKYALLIKRLVLFLSSFSVDTETTTSQLI